MISEQDMKRGLLMLESVLLSLIDQIGNKNYNYDHECELYARTKIAIAMLREGSKTEENCGSCQDCEYPTTCEIDGEFVCPFCKWKG